MDGLAELAVEDDGVVDLSVFLWWVGDLHTNTCKAHPQVVFCV
jgi:hypothetical protein